MRVLVVLLLLLLALLALLVLLLLLLLLPLPLFRRPVDPRRGSTITPPLRPHCVILSTIAAATSIPAIPRPGSPTPSTYLPCRAGRLNLPSKLSNAVTSSGERGQQRGEEDRARHASDEADPRCHLPALAAGPDCPRAAVSEVLDRVSRGGGGGDGTTNDRKGGGKGGFVCL